MAKPPRGLGRGLSALIPDAPSASPPIPPAPDARFREIPLSAIHSSPWQPRKTFDPDAIAALAGTIREKGLIQPLVVRARTGGGYELVAGERRFRALRSLGEAKAPVVVLEASDADVRELALIENLQRADLNPIEEAEAYQALIVDKNLTQDQVADRLGVARASVANTVRLLRLPDAVKQLLAEGQLSAGHAKAVLSLPDAGGQERLARRKLLPPGGERHIEYYLEPEDDA